MRRVIALAAASCYTLCLMIGAAGFAPAEERGAHAFTVEQVLSAPFASGLISAPDAERFAWVSDSQGQRNVWLAQLAGNGGGTTTQALTRYTQDDGQEIGDLAFVPRHEALLFVRGGDFENPDKPAPNPAELSAGVEQGIYLVDFKGGAPAKLADGHAPIASPSGDRILYLHKGEIWTIAPQAGASPAQLFKARGDLDSVRFSPDGSRLAFVSNRGDHSFIGIYTFADQSLHWVDPGLDYDLEPRWSPDGGRLAFLRVPSTHDEVGIGPHKTGSPWSIRVAAVDTVSSDPNARALEAYRAPRGAGSVFHSLSSDQQLFWTAGDRIVFPAENDGWLHLYAVPAKGGETKLLTPGNFEIEYAAARPDGSSIVYAGNAGDIDRRHLWKVALPSGSVAPLTHGPGIETEPVVAADTGTVAFLRSDAQLPMHAAVIGPGATPVDLAAEAVPKDFPRSLAAPVSLVLPARAGLAAHALLFLPPERAAKRHAALLFMHGGPIRQMLAGWHYMDYYSNAYGFNQYLASRGYVVLALNYRAGIGYGLDYREADGYGVAGASEYNDLLAAAAYLRARPDVDPSRIGLWGGSYGGYLTALGLARNSDLFAAGVDMHGVHDWYRWSLGVRDWHPYYAADAPADVLSTAYASSPVSSLSSWKSPVLLIHGDDDRNVAFTESVRLAEALRAQGVEYSELVFPDEIHGFLRHASWLRAYHASADFFDAKLAAH